MANNTLSIHVSIREHFVYSIIFKGTEFLSVKFGDQSMAAPINLSRDSLRRVRVADSLVYTSPHQLTGLS
jgi:hypothetical protein